MEKNPTELTQERLRELVSYDPETGEFVRINGRVSAVGKIAKSKNQATGYLQMCVDGRTCCLHRLAWIYVNGSIPAGNNIDHIDGNKTNNTIKNLRLATKAQNMQNRFGANRNNVSGLLGVVPLPKGRWRAIIQIDKKVKHIGCYKTAAEAHQAYLAVKAAMHPFGEIAKEYRK